jgi:Tol biopolymer transport system component
VSVDSQGNQADYGGWYPDISWDGNFVTFESDATDLVPDSNGYYHIYIHNTVTGATEAVSVNTSGALANSDSYFASISADGRYVAFESFATDLISPPPVTMMYQAYVRDMVSETTELVSINNSGDPANGYVDTMDINADGRYVAFLSNATNIYTGPGITNIGSVYIHDRDTDTTELVSVNSSGEFPDGESYGGHMSADGRYVTFDSYATDLVSPPITNTPGLVYVRDRNTDTTELVSINNSGDPANNYSEWPSISADGRYVAFRSDATNLVSGVTGAQVYVHDRTAESTEVVSVNSSGTPGNGYSTEPKISPDGRYVAFHSWATNLVSDDTNNKVDVFVHDRTTGETIRVSEGVNGLEGNDGGYTGAISNTLLIAFDSWASNLVSGDTNGYSDVFVHDPLGDNDGDTYLHPEDCDDTDEYSYPGATETKHDGIDQDCNGYDLTIDITDISYNTRKDSLTVKATSSYGAAADLVLDDYSLPMTYKGSTWSAKVQPAGGLPPTITVSGPEGSETVPSQ